MQHSPTDIKDRLLRGLDEEYNVVDMGVVVEVISILEKMPITKEALEATRLGKCVNLLRKKTDNEVLAKRAKNLVKRWRNLVDLTGSSQQNGAAVDKSALNAHEPLVESVPRTHAANKRLRKAQEDDTESYEPLKKKSRINGLTRSQPVIANAEGECSRRDDPVPVEYSQPAEAQVPQDPPPELPPGPKKRGRKKGSKNRSTLLKAAGVPPPNDDPIKEKIASISRTPKVKTTQELVAMLGTKTSDLDVAPKDRSSSLKNSSKKDQSLSSKYLSRSEEVQSTSEEPGSPHIVVDDSPAREKLEPPPPEEPPPITPAPAPKLNTVEEIMSQLPPVDVDAISWDETPVPSPPANPVVTAEDLDRLHSEYVEGLNGVWEHSGASTQSETFREWHEMVHRRSYHDDLLRILPYTVID